MDEARQWSMISGPRPHITASDSVGRFSHISAGGSSGVLVAGGIPGSHGVVTRKDWSSK